MGDAQANQERTQPAAPVFKGLLAEFETAGQLLAAARQVRAAGYARIEAYAPYPLHGLDDALGARPTRLPWIVLASGLSGLFGGLTLVWYTNASFLPVPTWLQGYQFIISGKPIFSLPGNIPVIFETTVLLSALAAVFGMFALNRLPSLYNPLFRSERFRRATVDRFFITVDASDPRFERSGVEALLRSCGASAVEAVED